jgi:hypothetical protein
MRVFGFLTYCCLQSAICPRLLSFPAVLKGWFPAVLSFQSAWHHIMASVTGCWLLQMMAQAMLMTC